MPLAERLERMQTTRQQARPPPLVLQDANAANEARAVNEISNDSIGTVTLPARNGIHFNLFSKYNYSGNE